MFLDSANSLSPEELHTLALDASVRCTPQQDIGEHLTLFRTYGPFKANMPCEMPLFMAMQLDVQIELSLFYHDQELDKLLKQERLSQHITRLPHCCFFEIGFILRHSTKRLNDLRNIRFDKALVLIKSMHPRLVRFGHLTSYETAFLRPLILPLLCYMRQLTADDTVTAATAKKRYNELVSTLQEE